MLKGKLSKASGVSLLEFVATLAIATLVSAAILGLFTQGLNANKLNMNKSILDNTLQTVMDIMTQEIQRAGYWGNAVTSNTNPFMTAGTDIAINGECVLFTYDNNADGTLPSISSSIDDERYGFRKSGSVLQFRPAGAPFDCTTATANWENMTDPAKITITNFSVSLNNEAVDIDGAGSNTDTINYRTVTLTISGQLANNSNITKTITRTIKLYNLKYET